MAIIKRAAMPPDADAGQALETVDQLLDRLDSADSFGRSIVALVDRMHPPCFIDDLAFEAYMAHPAPGSSFLWRMLDRSPYHARYAPPLKGDQFSLGTLVHSLLLEPDLAEEQVLVLPSVNITTNAGKAELVEFYTSKLTMMEVPEAPDKPEGKRLDAILKGYREACDEMGYQVVGKEMMDTAKAMRDSVLSTRLGSVTLDKGVAERSMFIRDPVTGLHLKGRVDWIPDGHELLIDVKTTQSAKESDFARSMAKYGYHVQTALYRWIHQLIIGARRPWESLHLVVESEPPYDTVFYRIDEDAITRGEQKMRRAIDMLSWCVMHNEWPGLAWSWNDQQDEIKPLSLPGWAK
jgi:hypothetical protein